MRIFGLLGCLGLAAISLASNIEPLTIGDRSYTLATSSHPRDGKHPLVILLHGHGGTARQVLGLMRSASPLAVWMQIVDEQGIIVAALDGSDGHDGKQGWNDGRPDARGNPSTDDLSFIRGVIDESVKTRNADPDRVYIMGMSNGGMMTFRAAVELDRPIAGFAAVCASMAPYLVNEKPKKHMRAMIIAGTEDPLVPFDGGEVHYKSMERGKVVSVPDAVSYWRKVDGVESEAEKSYAFPHLGGLRDSTRAEAFGYGSEVEFVKITGGGHVEPSIEQKYGQVWLRIVGQQNHDVECVREAWKFFNQKSFRN